MATPTQKHPQINAAISSVLGKSRVDTIRANKCMTCDKDVTGFRDPKSAREYTISGMCQECQDSVFGKEEVDFL